MDYEKSIRDRVRETERAGVRPSTICFSLSWGGLEQVAATDCAELARLGLPVSAIVLEGSPVHENLRKQSGVDVVAIDFRPKNFFDWRLKAALEAEFDKGVNLLHTHQTTFLGSVMPWLWRRPEISFVASRHIMSGHSKKNPFHRALYGRLDALVVMSQALKQNVLETHPLPEEKIRTIHLGLDFDRFDPAKVDAEKRRASFGATPETVVIGMVGRIDPAKGQDTFLHAAAGLRNRLKGRYDLKFVIVGEETLGQTAGTLQELKAMVEQLHLEDHVVFAGYQEDIPEVMQAFDIFVMPSRQETFGLVAIEAMAMECPILITQGGSAREIVGGPMVDRERDGEEFGMLIRPRNAFDLQTKLMNLVEREDLRRAMGKKARAHVMAHYDRKKRVSDTLGLYLELHGRRNRG